MTTRDFMVRTSIPEETGTIVGRVFDLQIPILVSASVFWNWLPAGQTKTGRFKEPSGRLGDLPDIALDSAGFTAQSKWGGYPWSWGQYVELAALLRPTWWASMDLCCEPEIAADRSEVGRRIWETTTGLVMLLTQVDCWRAQGMDWLQDPMPVIQGWTPDDYCRSAGQIGSWLGKMGREWPALVGVGSVCRRTTGGIADILDALDRELPKHVRCHFFGAESAAVRMLAVHSRAASTDSMAWDYAARMGKKGQPSRVADRADAMERWVGRQREHAEGPLQVRLRF